MINDIRICTKINSVMFCIQGVFFLMVRDFNAKKHKVMISYFFYIISVCVSFCAYSFRLNFIE
ncbi:Uncharacterised protein [Shigella flexneri 2a]|nr:Uncharacterised protein [Shigella flexneri 2a]SRK57073.1 Uncharacterised protein [Shigella flexneri]SRG41401.1 Uncharacterised protein [Shigella flexneri 2a]SRG44570.1 Uncharacterised protein [Shigella flexneri 2a]SRG81655.1 Uncharacterised protein [Shigella flexneri 2a]